MVLEVFKDASQHVFPKLFFAWNNTLHQLLILQWSCMCTCTIVYFSCEYMYILYIRTCGVCMCMLLHVIYRHRQQRGCPLYNLNIHTALLKSKQWYIWYTSMVYRCAYICTQARMHCIDVWLCSYLLSDVTIHLLHKSRNCRWRNSTVLFLRWLHFGKSTLYGGSAITAVWHSRI